MKSLIILDETFNFAFFRPLTDSLLFIVWVYRSPYKFCDQSTKDYVRLVYHLWMWTCYRIFISQFAKLLHFTMHENGFSILCCTCKYSRINQDNFFVCCIEYSSSSNMNLCMLLILKNWKIYWIKEISSLIAEYH